LIVRTNTTKRDQCFSFSSQGTICLPITAVPEIIHCPTFISSNLLVNTTVNLFPRTITNKNLTQEADLSQDLISLTLNNGSVPVNIDEDSPEVITVTFKHESKHGDDEVRQCVWWDDQELSWSSAGCEVSSTSTMLTTCHCKHLTNFGIMFDYTGDADASDPYLNILTYILLTISSLSILATQCLDVVILAED